MTLGPDETICTSLSPAEYTLGENVQIMDAVPPYTYSWSAEVETFFSTYTASDFLNDTTLAQPELIDFGIDSLTFALKITDAEGNTCSDSISLFICYFGVDLGDGNFTINQGDTATIYSSVASDCAPVTYQWEPDYNISDVNAAMPQVWPDTTTFYTNVATDSAGCSLVDGDVFEVYVNPLNTTDEGALINPTLYPNPMTEFATIDLRGQNSAGWQLIVYDSMGRRMRSETITSERHIIRREQLESGFYTFQLLDQNQRIGTGRFVVE